MSLLTPVNIRNQEKMLTLAKRQACIAGIKHLKDKKDLFAVSGKREMLPRFILEDAIKPPLFGSYSYDPIKQVFEIEQQPKNDTMTHNRNQTHFSTKEGAFMRNRPVAHSRLFRKHVSVSTTTGISVSQPTFFKWWTKRKSLIRNATRS